MLLASSFSARLDTYFEGYCFDGADYIAEFAGYAWFRQATGRDIGPGLDGCYTVARWVGETYEIGVDSRGLGKLFLYRAGSEWAVGSSLHGLVRYLRENGKELTPRPIIFDAFLTVGHVRAAIDVDVYNVQGDQSASLERMLDRHYRRLAAEKCAHEARGWLLRRGAGYVRRDMEIPNRGAG